MTWHIQRLDSSHEVSDFDCGEPTMNAFLARHALGNDRAGLGRTFVATESAASRRVAGYFTISTGSVSFNSVPDHARKRLPRYPIPTVHLGRMAVDRRNQGRKLGEVLLIEALLRAGTASASIGVYAVDLLALNDRAKGFYLKYGFVEMLDNPLHLFLPIATARALAKLHDE